MFKEFIEICFVFFEFIIPTEWKSKGILHLFIIRNLTPSHFHTHQGYLRQVMFFSFRLRDVTLQIDSLEKLLQEEMINKDEIQVISSFFLKIWLLWVLIKV